MLDSQRAEAQHRRQTRLFIWLPFGAAILLILGAVVVAALLPLRLQLSVVSDFVLTVLVLCPMAICLLPLYIALVVLIAAMNRLHHNTAHALGRAVNWSQSLSRRVDQAAGRLERWSIQWSTRLAPLEKTLFSLFEGKTNDQRSE